MQYRKRTVTPEIPECSNLPPLSVYYYLIDQFMSPIGLVDATAQVAFPTLLPSLVFWRSLTIVELFVWVSSYKDLWFADISVPKAENGLAVG